MKKIDLYEVAIKITGLCFTVVLLGQMRDVLMYASILLPTNGDPNAFNGVNQMPVFLVIVFCFLALTAFTALLIFKTKAVAQVICSKEDFAEPVTLFMDKQSIYEIALLLTGLLTILLVLPDLILHLKNYTMALKSLSGPQMDTGFMISDAMKIVIGVLAVRYAKPVASFFGKDKSSSKSE